MRFLFDLEKKYGRYAIQNLTAGIVSCQAACFVVGLVDPQAMQLLTLNPALVLQGEVWRLVTFLAVPPPIGLIFAIFYFYLFYLMGTALENHWGIFRYNVYLLVGYMANVAVAIIAGMFLPEQANVSSAFLQGTVFLAFAQLYPEFELRLFFVLPVKVKWLALLAWVGYGFAFLSGLSSFQDGGWLTSLIVVASVSNFLLFFGAEFRQRAHYAQRRSRWQARVTRHPDEVRHRCTVCDITNLSHPDMDFRYCTQCDGAQGYCTEHIRNHAHIATSNKEEFNS